MSKLSDFATVQELGGAADGLQRHRVRAGQVRTRSGDQITMAVIAESDLGESSASRAIEQIFQTVEGARARGINAALRRGFEIAGQGLAKSGGETPKVSSTAVAVSKSRLFYAHVGRSRAYRVAGDEAIQLTRQRDERLGSASIQAGPDAGLSLQEGDRVVLASDSLFRASSSDGKAFVEPNQIPSYIEGLPASEAARHLASIALGRDVDDNVSIAVIGAARAPRRSPLVAIAAGAAALILLAVAALAVLSGPSEPPATDFGFAVLVEGGVQATVGEGAPHLVSNLGTIPALALLTAQTDAKLGLQTTHSEGSDLARGDIYLGQGTEVVLESIDQRTEDATNGYTGLTLTDGRVLILRQSGTREYRIQHADLEASLIGAGPGALAAEASDGSFVVHCLIGTCRLSSAAGEPLLLGNRQTAQADGSAPISTSQSVFVNWNQLCSGCLEG